MFRKKKRLVSKRREERGFSMIEMMVVLLIIAVVAAFVVPQIVTYMRMYRVGVAARNIATALQRARFLATSNNTRAGILIPEQQRVDIQQYDPEGKGEPLLKGAVTMPEGVTIDSEAPRQLAFDGRGVVTPLPTERATIRVNGAKGYYATVVVSPTGQITISEAKEDTES